MRSQSKRTAACTLALLLLAALFHITAFAADKTYEIEELGMKIALPADLSVITRTTEKSDPAYAALGYTYAAAQKEMEQADIYLKGVPKDASYEADVYMVQNEHSRDVYNFKLLTEAQLEAVKKELEADESSKNCTMTQTDDAVFFNLETEYEVAAEGSAKATKIYSVMSYTVVNGIQVSFSLRSIGKPVTVAQQGVFNTAAGSIAFNEILQKPLQVDIAGIMITAAVVLAVVVAAAAVIIILRGRKKRRKAVLLQERRYDRNSQSPLSGFCDELEKDGLLGSADDGRQAPAKQEEPPFSNQPVRVTVEVPVTQGEDDGIRAVDETKEKRQAGTHEDEAGSVELTRSNNEDYDEAAAEENNLHNGKLRIFVGGAGSKIKNSVSSIGDLLKSRQEAESEQKQQEETLDDYDPLRDDTYAGTDRVEPEPLPEDFEQDILQAQPEKEEACQNEEEALAEPEETGEADKEEKPRRQINSRSRESFVQASGADEILKSFEEDNYWDRYR